MGATTRPVFIVGSGRSGTQMMDKMLSLSDEVESHHEYLCNLVQPLSVKYYLGIISRDEVLEQVKKIFGAAIHYSEKSIWVDSSNKTSWIIDILVELFPSARFVHVVRDGRKVVSSFYNKLNSECYDDHSVSILRNWVTFPHEFMEPPAEKRYWWNLPNKDSKFFESFKSFDQFERMCFHWGEVTRTISDTFEKSDQIFHSTFRLEDLIANEEEVRRLYEFIELDYKNSFFESLQRPHNINKKVDILLNEKQKLQLDTIAGDMMRRYAYDRTVEYKMRYNSRDGEE